MKKLRQGNKILFQCGKDKVKAQKAEDKFLNKKEIKNKKSEVK